MESLDSEFAPAVAGSPNGTPPMPSQPVRFGPNDHQVIRVEWAEHILSRLFIEHRSWFGKYLLQAMQGPGDGK